VDVAGVANDDGTLSFFLVNRHTTDSIETEINLQGFANAQVIDHQVMTHPDLKAVNTAQKQDEVAPRKGDGAKVDGDRLTVTLPAYSYQMVRVRVG
jgi:alpha-L-arabinofuranosidase